MSEAFNRQWILVSRPDGMVSESNFDYRETSVPVPADGQMLVRNLVLSFEPAMRGWMNDRPSYIPPVRIGEPMRAFAIAQVVESKHSGFEAGEIVQGAFGWQDYAVTSEEARIGVRKVPEGVPPSWSLGVLGLTGLTAYFGLLDIGKPASGETVVVSGAAGATGSVAGQIAKIKGCKTVGIAGGPEKCRWLRDTARFDGAIDYKNEDVEKKLEELCPEGIDVYFDNVGGKILDAALARINRKARVVLSGAISIYNAKEPPPGPRNYFRLIIQRARMEGFIILDYSPRFREATEQLAAWVKKGTIRFQENVRTGFENIPKTLIGLYEGENLGKQLLKLADPV
jgi:NADPH-dependent curcumin reductase CurA